MSSGVCAIAADTKVETPEGAMAIRTVAGKAIAVFTRDATGRARFRMMQDVRKVGEQQPVLTITLESGHTFRVCPHQVMFKKGMVECRADGLHRGDALEPIFHYPLAYQYRDDASGTERASSAGLSVTAVEPGGTADVYSLAVHPSGCFFLTAGVLCKAEESAATAA